MQVNAHRAMDSKQIVLKDNGLRGLVAKEGDRDSQVVAPMALEQAILKANALQDLVVKEAAQGRVVNPVR